MLWEVIYVVKKKCYASLTKSTSEANSDQKELKVHIGAHHVTFKVNEKTLSFDSSLLPAVALHNPNPSVHSRI
jgi:hypothetical protein